MVKRWQPWAEALKKRIIKQPVNWLLKTYYMFRQLYIWWLVLNLHLNSNTVCKVTQRWRFNRSGAVISLLQSQLCAGTARWLQSDSLTYTAINMQGMTSAYHSGAMESETDPLSNDPNFPLTTVDLVPSWWWRLEDLLWKLRMELF